MTARPDPIVFYVISLIVARERTIPPMIFLELGNRYINIIIKHADTQAVSKKQHKHIPLSKPRLPELFI